MQSWQENGRECIFMFLPPFFCRRRRSRPLPSLVMFQETRDLAMRRLMYAVVPAVAILCLLPAVLMPAEGRTLRKFRRAALPKFAAADGAGIFFEDVFSQGVSGPRPTAPLRSPASVSPAPEAPGTPLKMPPAGQLPASPAPARPAVPPGAD